MIEVHVIIIDGQIDQFEVSEDSNSLRNVDKWPIKLHVKDLTKVKEWQNDSMGKGINVKIQFDGEKVTKLKGSDKVKLFAEYYEHQGRDNLVHLETKEL